MTPASQDKVPLFPDFFDGSPKHYCSLTVKYISILQVYYQMIVHYLLWSWNHIYVLLFWSYLGSNHNKSNPAIIIEFVFWFC